jgi:formylglycine-generating enzyme required for sulfatase activity
MRTTFLFSFLLCVGFLLMACFVDKDIEMVYIKGGSFEMGSNDGDDDEKPVHTVTVNGFYMSKYEVTVGQYLEFCKATNTHFPEWLEQGNSYHVEQGTDNFYKNLGYSRTANQDLPIVGVSWNDAVAYTQWLSEKTGKNYRLPTEAEWEYAAKGGQNYEYAGSDNLDEVGWYWNNSNETTHPVGQKLPNGYGLYDMSGNVWEWCQDMWHDNYNGAPINGSAWTSGGEVSRRVLRGGAWSLTGFNCCSSFRDRDITAYRNINGGFRLARD